MIEDGQHPKKRKPEAKIQVNPTRKKGDIIDRMNRMNPI
jgi:hypothetical protein